MCNGHSVCCFNLIKGLCNNYQEDGRRKMRLPRRNITQYLLFQQSQISSDPPPNQSPKNYDDPPPEPPPTNIVNILESFILNILESMYCDAFDISVWDKDKDKVDKVAHF